MTASSHCTSVVAASPDAVFAAITGIARLPEWNARMTRVIEAPSVLAEGAEWVIEFHALGSTWRSRSRLEEFDATRRRFAYRSMTDDGNPSFAQWAWTVDADPDGSRVTVTWSLHPATFWRRLLLARVRARQLARTEVPASLAALATFVTGAAEEPAGVHRPRP